MSNSGKWEPNWRQLQLALVPLNLRGIAQPHRLRTRESIELLSESEPTSA